MELQIAVGPPGEEKVVAAYVMDVPGFYLAKRGERMVVRIVHVTPWIEIDADGGRHEMGTAGHDR